MVTTPDLRIVNKCSIHEWCNLNKRFQLFFFGLKKSKSTSTNLLPLKNCSFEPPTPPETLLSCLPPTIKRPRGNPTTDATLRGGAGRKSRRAAEWAHQAPERSTFGEPWAALRALRRWLAVGVAGVSQREIPENTTDIQHIMDPFTLDLVNFFKRKHCLLGGVEVVEMFGEIFGWLRYGHYSGWVATGRFF